MFSRLVFEAPKDEEDSFDQKFMNAVATRVFTIRGGTGNLDFSEHNRNELVNPGESKWKWKTIEDYVGKTIGMTIELMHMKLLFPNLTLNHYLISRVYSPSYKIPTNDSKAKLHNTLE